MKEETTKSGGGAVVAIVIGSASEAIAIGTALVTVTARGSGTGTEIVVVIGMLIEAIEATEIVTVTGKGRERIETETGTADASDPKTMTPTTRETMSATSASDQTTVKNLVCLLLAGSLAPRGVVRTLLTAAVEVREAMTILLGTVVTGTGGIAVVATTMTGTKARRTGAHRLLPGENSPISLS